VLHVSGYALKEIGCAEAPRISLDLATAGAIDDTFRRRAAELRPDVVFATEGELAVFGRLDAETLVVKHGAAGFTVNGERYAAAPAEAVDATGAGDALAAGFLVGGPELAREAAARCVAKVGAMP
jgi:sugar/nucleoside kinase (ribokinase family)